METNEEKQEYDFIETGRRFAQKKVDEYQQMAAFIEKEYGPEALRDFEMGSLLPFQDNIFQEQNPHFSIHGTMNFGVPNLRNNSYFGRTGISFQYIDGVYNDPGITLVLTKTNKSN